MAAATNPEIIDYLLPFFSECKQQVAQDQTVLAEINIVRQLLEVACAIAEELDCDTQVEQGMPAKIYMRSLLSQAFKTLDTIEQDISRPLEERRAELVASLSKYQRDLLGIE